MNLREHVPKTCGWPLPYTRIMREGLSALSQLPLHADNLAQRVHHVDQIALRFHHRVDGLVRHRRLVDDVRILTALDAGRAPMLPGIIPMSPSRARTAPLRVMSTFSP